MSITYGDFERVEIHVGRIQSADAFPEARRPAYRLTIDFGTPVGVKRASAQLTRHYLPERLVGRQIVAVTNFPPKQIGPMRSEVLVLGVPDGDGGVVLLVPERDVPLGGRVF